MTVCIANISFAQKDTGVISFHFQQTLIAQKHSIFRSPYSGENSLLPKEETAVSLTGTLFLAIKTWQNGLIIVNPEVAGGTGLSGATGIAGFPNGEIFRVGSPKPTPYLARLIIEQRFPLHPAADEYIADDVNTVRGRYPVNYIKIYAGRFCLADYFDNNPYSHDPRSQFLNWSIMSAGAWDYAADTRGYTWGIGGEWKNNNWRAATAITMEPKEANALKMDQHIGKAFATQAEITHYHTINGDSGQIQATVFFNKAHMGNYAETIKQYPAGTDVTATADYKHHKWGWILNAAQQLSRQWGGFARLSWNDGNNETWAFTEIDRSANIGVQWSNNTRAAGNILGISTVLNGLSMPHKNYLAAGGYGFIIGDGRLNYAPEFITEAYYRFNFFNNHLQLSPDYQLVVNPAYNKDRGPVHIFAIRTHVEW